ncbi:hypothetical protein TWF788_010546 [Orbilia oligospora]|uniref:SUZ domain-containing protein n=1 Tax=Orbilia oligospora TaxID=2813651 RepID=A0A6G1LW13_ORBOL|nr:hypothetical protein TWF788_010546 [Orbilia oligospora]KAF3208998.1 hypothetical protein TWF679_007518 [Orbilia oligospora]KAF3232239.1 hypothetical protein TWF191_000015 [Orbilia oligospora]KAF3234906.1 hypothetical protein TWF192_001164 [Orbilia oligospora]
MAAIGGQSGGASLPDAWNDDDWGTGQKPATSEPIDQLEATKKPSPPSSGNPPIILAKKPASSPNPGSADDLSTHMQNMQIWNAANEGGSFEVVAAVPQSGKTLYRPELKILKRAANTNSPERDPNKAGSRTPKSDGGSDGEVKKETPQEKMERERKEKEERYAKARERLFGPDTSGSGGGDSMEKNPSSNGKNSGTATPSGVKTTGQQNKNIPSRKTSPSSRQRRRERVDDDFVPRSAMVAGTVESYQLDQQLQAEAQMREIQSRTAHFQSNVPQAPYMGYQTQYTSPPPGPANFNYNNQSGFPPLPQQQQQPSFNGGQGGNFPPRQPSHVGASSWNNSFSSPPMQPPPPHQFNQFQNQNQLPYQVQQHQVSPPNFQPPYSPPFHQQGAPANMPNQGLPLPQNLYDPSYSQKPGHPQFFNQNANNGPPVQFPMREPKVPDGTGHRGSGFTGRGGSHVMGLGSMTHHPPVPQGRGFPNPMFAGNNQQNPHGGPGAGFNSPAAAAPWGVTNPIGSQQPGQIWGSVPNGNSMNGNQGYLGQQPPLMGSSYSGLGQNNVWANPGTWNTAGGQGSGRGKR